MPGPGDGNTLYLHTRWGESLFVSEYSFAELMLEVAKLEVGTLDVAPGHRAIYTEGGQSLLFQSTTLEGTVEITSICFSNSLDENDQLRLFSIGKDRRCFEYNVATACPDPGLMVEHMFFLGRKSLESVVRM